VAAGVSQLGQLAGEKKNGHGADGPGAAEAMDLDSMRASDFIGQQCEWSVDSRKYGTVTL